MNAAKCELWGPGVMTWADCPCPSFPSSIPQDSPLRQVPITAYVPLSGVTVLGSPVSHPAGQGQYAQDLWQSRLAGLDRTLQVLTAVPDSQLQYCLLRVCLDACRVNFLLRTTPLDHAGTQVLEASKKLRCTLSAIIGLPLLDHQWEQASLPVRLGGLGIRDPAQERLAARLASALDYSSRASATLGLPDDLVPLPPDLVLLQSQALAAIPDCPEARALATPRTLQALPPHCSKQHWWGDLLHRKRAMALSSLGTTRDQVRLAAQRQPHAGVWLTAPPMASLGMRLPSLQWQCLLKWWLGMPQISDPAVGGPCPKCTAPVDSLGDHVVCCTKNNIQRRHVALQDALESILVDAGLQCQREVGYGDGTRAADLLVPRWDADGPAAIDLTVRCPVAPHQPLRDPGRLPSWRETQEEEKLAKYEEGTRRAGWSFHPFLVDTWGGLGPTASRFMTVLVRRAARARTGPDRRLFEMTVWQRLLFPVMAQLARQLTALLAVPHRSLVPPVVSSIATTSHSPYAL